MADFFGRVAPDLAQTALHRVTDLSRRLSARLGLIEANVASHADRLDTVEGDVAALEAGGAAGRITASGYPTPLAFSTAATEIVSCDVPPMPFDRIMATYARMLVASVDGAFYCDLALNVQGGVKARSRVYAASGPGSHHVHDWRVLPANTAGSAVLEAFSNTSGTLTVAGPTNSQFNLLDVMWWRA